MIKRALLVVGFLALCFPVAAQQNNPTDEFDAAAALALYRPEIFSTVDSLALIDRLPVLNFLDGTRLPVSSEMGRMGTAPVEFPSITYMSLAYVSAAPAQKVKKASQVDGKESPGDVINSPSDHYYYGGEMGFLYGRSTGKFGYDDFETYIVGEVGDDKFHISVGASYEELNGHGPRLRH